MQGYSQRYMNPVIFPYYIFSVLSKNCFAPQLKLSCNLIFEIQYIVSLTKSNEIEITMILIKLYLHIKEFVVLN